jgi:hypothetical protein
VLNSALTLPRLLLLLVLGCAGLVWAVQWPHHRAPRAHADRLFSLWAPLRELGCAPPNEHGTFIAAKLLPDEHGNPYIFECTADGLRIDGVQVR